MTDRYVGRGPAQRATLTRQGYALLWLLYGQTSDGPGGHRPSIAGRMNREGQGFRGMTPEQAVNELRAVGLCGDDGTLTDAGRAAAMAALFEPRPLMEEW